MNPYTRDRREVARLRPTTTMRGNNRANGLTSLLAFLGAAWLLWLLFETPVREFFQ